MPTVVLTAITGSLSVATEVGRAVTGQVVDAAGAPVPQATVTVVQADRQHHATTNPDGTFVIEGVAPGAFHVIAVYGDASVRAVSDGERPIALRLDIRPEEIRIREAAPAPAVLPALVRSTLPRKLTYSDEAKDRNGWYVVWVLLHVTSDGRVASARILKSPRDVGLDKIALDTAKNARYEPARDADGHRMEWDTILVLEWPPFWLGGRTLAVCEGSGPLNLDRPSVYRDCDPPKGYEHLRLRPIRDRTTFNPGSRRAPSRGRPPH